MNRRQRRKPLTLAQLAMKQIFAELATLPVGESRVYLNCGPGGAMVVTRHSAHALSFSRQVEPGGQKP